ncbi:helix-hairpin-helix domain-containing protein [Gemella haemolysans]|uniref:ComE operon protein 1 n=1 Tax=Gemella haemolysans ATCC 10379 TaxID=546270 RepID=C5NY25_9BACL|nr:helix-hairpin-helix domain-containing protein [Gemella haemolysans]EER67746.1 ComE operon protein 1 [Gemella haemolysans ATCC 10379]KAA8709188.1 ComEA family DNA-binding protein [Gemella haemolysans]UBH82884.1 helix-hairpin-helix domain-containing protein [Gemella haemolysans]VEI38851.1 ComE operon protein 1 [Gemella haemolysans]
MNIKKEDVVLFFRQNVKSIILAFVCSLVLIIGGLFYFNKNKTEDYSGVSFSNISNETNNKDEKAENRHDEKIFVDVKGAVKHPGVFETTKDKRVKDLIEEAGGLLDDADTSTLNLSQKVKDQMVIYVLKHGEKPKQISDGGSSSSNTDVININTANKERLMKISGVGKTKAEAIISYREKNGDFKKKEDITKVHGIGKATFEKIKDKIEV